MKAIIVGAGIAGIAASIRLAVAGWEVEVFETAGHAGGKISEFKKNGYRFDAGPSLFTLPGLVEELFLLAGKKPEDFFKYQKAEVACRYFYPDGQVLTAYSDAKKFGEEVKEKLGVAPEVLEKYFAYSANIYKHTSKVFLGQSLHRWRNFVSKDVFHALRKSGEMDIFKTMDEANRERLKHPKLVQLFNRYATYNGSNPYTAPGILNVIPSLEHEGGVYFPEKGMVDIPQSLFALAQELGVVFRFNSPVDKIELKNKKAVGIVSGGKLYPSDIVVSNMDITPTYRRLLKGAKEPEKTLSQERSSSAIIFYWGIDGSFPNLDLHNIFFSGDYKTEFDYLFKGKDMYEDPTVYVHISSKMKPGDAPAGCENWFVMVNAPADYGQNWFMLKAKMRAAVLQKLSKSLGEDISQLIVAEEVLDPVKIEQRTSSYRGSLYGASSNNRYAAFLRHPNFSPSIGNLFFCGGSVHPGGGIPLCLMGAKIMADEVARGKYK